MTHPPHDPHGPPLVVESGTRLGPYEILLCIARGGMASVWAARQHGARGFSRLVALKTILPELDAPDLDGMFLDEARVTARIHHPNVCEVFELIEHGGVLALSMEWVDGDTLNNIITSRPKDPALDPRVAAQIIAHVASGLHAAHELRDERGAPLQLVHRDVSPQNILVSRSGHVKVTDFGVAKSLGAVREATAIGKIKGKLSYMSPEQAQGKILDRRSDIFSLGVVLYLATVGSHPFRRSGESRAQQLARLLSGRVKLPSDVVKNYPKELEVIVMRALSRNPAQRYGTAEEMARRLQDWVVASGPLVTEQQISQLVLRRAGPAILQRSERIANLLHAHHDEPSAETSADELPSPHDPTLVPTTSRSGSVSPERKRARATLRVVSTTLTAGAIGLAASYIFSGPIQAPQHTPPTPAVLSAATNTLPAPTHIAAPPPAASTHAQALSAPASAPAAIAASAASAPAPAPSAAPAADVTPALAAPSKPATSLPPKAKPSSPRAASAPSKSTRSTKARKSAPPKRKRPVPGGDSFSIKSGR
ncbi:MAG TPA: protein kinase [Polyangiaceae bacterium]|nr:protein kinase [Polyangiaceae bacterium]